MFEILEYEFQVELLDEQGEAAALRKRQRVRFLQDNVIAFQDEAWGDGEILRNYRCSPGKAVDIYELGRKSFVLISLRERKYRGDIEEFHIEWEARRTFTRETEVWGTDITQPMKKVKVQVIFPQLRLPKRILLVEEVSRRTRAMPLEDCCVELPDRRWMVTWEATDPRLHEHYLLKWKW